MPQKTPLEKLFGSPTKVKVLQTFLASPNAYFSPSDVAKRADISVGATQKNIQELSRIGILQIKNNAKKKTKKTKNK